MSLSFRRLVRTALALVAAAPVFAPAAEEPPQFPPEQIEFFEKQVRPIFAEHCLKCHSADERKGGLTLVSRENVLKGGDTGPAIVPGKPADSELVRAVGYDPDGYQMPPDGKLPDELIATLTKWVEIGAPWPESKSAATAGPAEFNLEERAERWSFQPLKRVTPPAVQNAQWPRTPIDRFLLAQLEATGLQPATETDRRTWLRRAYLDTIGLPPTPSDVAEFVADESPEAYTRVGERLLASPHFGERWGRHWLDLVRYAETRGHEFDYDVPNAWHYRDFVIRALNDDVPYDRFVVEHVAGDLLEDSGSGERDRAEAIQNPLSSRAREGASTAKIQNRYSLRLHPETGANESILGTGFWFFGEAIHSPVDIRQEEADRFENMIDVYSKTFLGLTVACARCHDHKFDPITQRDFYALQGYLQSSSYRQAMFETMEHNRRIAAELEALRNETAAAFTRTFAETVEPTLDDLEKYLLAARDVIQTGSDSKPGTALNVEDVINQTAAQRQVQPDLLAEWTAHLQAAASDDSDPFHLWALMATGKETRLEAVVKKAWETFIPPPDPMVREQYLADQLEGRHVSAIDFLSDGPAFRFPRAFLLPLLLWQDDAAAPFAGFSIDGAVQWDPDFADLTTREGNESDPARISGWQRGGRVLRSPTFEIDRDLVYCQIRGGVNIYVSVDSHIVINGPLHGSLLSEHPRQDGWRWIALDVARYRGHRAHVEFIPRPGEPLEVAAIWRKDKGDEPVQYPSPARAFAHLVAYDVSLYTDRSSTDIDQIARLTAERSAAIAASVRRYYIPGPAIVPVYREPAQWALNHPRLFGIETEAAKSRFRGVFQPFLERRQQLISQIRRPSATAPCMLDGSAEDEYVFIRGTWKKPGETVPRRFLEVFDGHGPSTLDPQPSTLPGSGRLDLALQMVHPDQTPILPRVIVNRIWQHYFGRGIVPTPDDFGFMGQDPSHPELLDWLASELVVHDWSLKHIHRLILLSAAYRMASRVEGQGSRVEGDVREAASLDARPSHLGPHPSSLIAHPSTLDPQNVLLHRMNIKRLEGEIIRDQVLATSGRLDDRLYGKSVPVHLTPFMEGRGRPGVSGSVDGEGRRSVYIAVRRNFPDPFFQAFDFPNPHSSVGRRSVSNVPAQALALMNNPFVVEQARVWAERLLHESPGATAEERIDRLCRHAFGRAPSEEELASGVEFVRLQAAEYNGDEGDPRVWADFCHVLMNVKEFVFVQ